MTPTFESQRQAWEHIPVDDVGYFSATELLQLPDSDLFQLVADMERSRYEGWRNHDGRWRAGMGLDDVHGRVLDYGCGLGVEALQYARTGNIVSLADINASSIALASRVLRLHGYEPAGTWLVSPKPPFAVLPPGSLDLVVMNGVLHHIPDPVPVVRAAASWLVPGGELRVMVYSGSGWLLATGTSPPADVAGHPDRERFVRFFDGVGDWADWYDEARLAERFGEWFDIRDVRYITPDGRYLTATLARKP